MIPIINLSLTKPSLARSSQILAVTDLFMIKIRSSLRAVERIRIILICACVSKRFASEPSYTSVEYGLMKAF